MRVRTAARSTLVLAGALLLVSVRAHAGDRQIRPFVGATFGGGTTFLDLDNVVGGPNVAIGASAVFLGEVFGTEIEIADAPGFFQNDGTNLVKGSRVTTISGNVILAAPHRMTEYGLRPYLVGGAGLMRVKTTTLFTVFDVSRIKPAFDVGAGVVGFLTNRIGVAWDVRRFQSIGGSADIEGVSLGPEQLSFWRATMSVAIRY